MQDEPIPCFSVSTPVMAELQGKNRVFDSLRITALLVLLLSCGSAYFSVLRGLVTQWASDPDYAFAFAVPLFLVWVCYSERKFRCAFETRPSNSGLLIVLSGLVVLAVGTLGADLYLQRVSLPIVAAGLSVYFAGWDALRRFSFPLCFSLFMIPLPEFIYRQLTTPLQLVASSIGSAILEVLNIPVLREGNRLEVPHNDLAVAEACSGIRSLLSLMAVTIGYAHVSRSTQGRMFAAALAVFPVVIGLNAIRVALTSALVYGRGAEWAEGWHHAAVGWTTYGLALIVILTFLDGPAIWRREA